MCGIVGYLGKRPAFPRLIRGLKRLEYRGYDSAGVAVLSEEGIGVCKRQGRISRLEEAESPEGCVGIGHTRWATHGAPSEQNAHPHVFGNVAIVHNGIIENYESLKEECLARGEVFSSDTDSEVIAHLIEFYECGDLLKALKKTCERLQGSYAIAVLRRGAREIAACRRKSPLVVGTGEDGIYLASDIPALFPECEKFYPLEDGEFVLLRDGKLLFFDNSLSPVEKKGEKVSGEESSDLCGYPHYMRKEIAEIPASISKSLIDFSSKSRFSAFSEVLCQTEYLQIVACGTAYHSGIAAKYAIEELCRIPVEVTPASEYRYCEPPTRPNTLTLAVSQSGETADTLAAAELAGARGAVVAAVTNSPHSSLTRISDYVFCTRAGREIGVAATKSFNAQLAILYSLAAGIVWAKGKTFDRATLRILPVLAEQTVSSVEEMKRFAPLFAEAKSVYFIGRGADYCAALEGSLKLKEISYLPSEGYPAGELKHGPLALVEEGTPVVAILTRKSLAEKTMNAVSEVYARGGKVLMITSLPEAAARKEVFAAFKIPPCFEPFSPILSVIPLQALAYYTALVRGNDPDKPRNLAKSVTVE